MKTIKLTLLLFTLSTLTFSVLCSCEKEKKTNTTLTTKDSAMKAVQFRIARPTNQLAEVVAFYQNVLGLEIIGKFENHDGYDGVMMGLPDATYHLEFTQHITKDPIPEPTKENLMVLYYGNSDDYHEANERFNQFGIQSVEPENPYWKGKSTTYEDPDGWRIVLFDGVYQVSK